MASVKAGNETNLGDEAEPIVPSKGANHKDTNIHSQQDSHPRYTKERHCNDELWNRLELCQGGLFYVYSECYRHLARYGDLARVWSIQRSIFGLIKESDIDNTGKAMSSVLARLRWCRPHEVVKAATKETERREQKRNKHRRMYDLEIREEEMYINHDYTCQILVARIEKGTM